MNKTSLTAQIMQEKKEGGWTFVNWPDSVNYLGTGKASKIVANILGHEFKITSLPVGDGTHFLLLNKALLKTIGKTVGDTITIDITKPE
ncbi:MAG: DUF1905 domain-containing protein [Armatimonadetes bacterium]|nr:DUF1905 domain-containing protein [Armatimonadota bacterium]